MCLRYVLPEQAAAEREFLPALTWWRFHAKFNVAAEQYVPAIRLHDQQTEAVMVRWGLIPSWVEGDPSGPVRSCVHASRIERSRSCAPSWGDGRRCILPMAGYYAWQLTAEGHRQPYFVRLASRPVFGVAAIWDRWVSEDDDVIESCAMVCVPANELVSGIAGPAQGMPAILRRRDYAGWLKGNSGAAMDALQTYRARWMRAYPVSPRVNSAAIDDPALIHMAGEG